MKYFPTLTLCLVMAVTFATHHLMAQSAWNSMGPGPTTYNFNAITFLDANIGFTVGDNNMAYSTTNGGQTWVQRQVDTDFMDFEDVCFTNPSNGWIIEQGIGGSVYHSTDGGATWNPVSTNGGTFLSQVFFTDDNHGWITGINGRIARTTDGGTSWSDASLGFGQNLDIIAAYFLDSLIGVVACEQGTILRTTNGGTSWSQSSNSAISFANILDIDFADATFGVAGASDGVLRKSTNGGSSWSSMNSPTTDAIVALDFVTNTTGWIADDASQVFRTTDAGATWVSESVSFLKTSMYFLNANEGWMTAWNGFVYHTTTGGIVGKPEPIVLNETLRLHPNPASDRIFLTFNQPSKFPSEFRLYSANGTSIHSVIVPANKGGESTEILLPPLPAGIYAYQVTQAGHTTSGRVIIR